MSSKRILSNEKTVSDKDDPKDFTPGASGKSNITPAVPAAVIYKLLGFTAAMIGAPIGSYYLTLHSIFRGSSTLAGATAAIVANVILVAYVVVAMKEDQSERLAEEENAKKGE